MTPAAWLGVVNMLLLMSPYLGRNMYAGLAARRSRTSTSVDTRSELSCVVVCGLTELAPR